MPNPQNQNASVVGDVDDEVRAARMDADRWRDFQPLAGQFRVIAEQFESLPQPRVIPRGLFDTEEADAFDVNMA